MMNLFFDTRWFGPHGIGRFAKEVYSRLPNVSDITGKLKPSSPLDCVYLSHRLNSLPENSAFFSPGYNAPLRKRIPLAITIHDLTHIEFPESSNRLHRIYYDKITKPACHYARAVLTVSEYSRARIAEWSGLDASRIFNVGNGVNPDFCSAGDVFDWPRPYIFCVGNRKPHKNEIRTVNAFAAFAHRVPHDLIFSGSASESLMAEIHRNRLEARVAFLGQVSDRQLASVYRAAKVLAFVSLHEGFGLPVIEAMACGTPVVTSDVSSLPEVAGGAAMLVDPYSCSDIAQGLERVVSDATLAADMVRRGLKNAAQYSWEKTGDTVRKVVEDRLLA